MVNGKHKNIGLGALKQNVINRNWEQNYMYQKIVQIFNTLLFILVSFILLWILSRPPMIITLRMLSESHLLSIPFDEVGT